VSNPTGTDSWGDRVPLPDANKRSPRVYTNLQNIDLSTVTFANVEATGDPIQIEDINEDELRRIVLVNLARMCVAGEWTGLLEAGGGGEYNVVLPEDFINGTYDKYPISGYPPWGSGNTTTEALSVSTNNDKCFFFPFVSPESGVVGEMGIEVTAASSEANDLQVGIYSSVDTTGAPGTLLGKGVFDTESVAVVYDTSLSSEVTLVKGTSYWIGWCRSTTGIALTLRVIQSLYPPSMCTIDTPNINSNTRCIRLSGSDLSLPTTPTLTEFYPQSKQKISVTLEIT